MSAPGLEKPGAFLWLIPLRELGMRGIAQSSSFPAHFDHWEYCDEMSAMQRLLPLAFRSRMGAISQEQTSAEVCFEVHHWGSRTVDRHKTPCRGIAPQVHWFTLSARAPTTVAGLVDLVLASRLD